jgi:hypothetical protein
MGFPESRSFGHPDRASSRALATRRGSGRLREVSKTPREGRRHKLPDVGKFFAKEPPDRTPRKHEKLLYF